MPVYQVTSPNGRTYELNGPEGATEEDLQPILEELYNAEIDTGESTFDSTLTAVPRGALQSAASMIEGIGDITSDGTDPNFVQKLGRSAKDAAALEFRVNPAKEDEFAVQAGGVVGQVLEQAAELAVPITKLGAASKVVKAVGLGSAAIKGADAGADVAEQYGVEGDAGTRAALMAGFGAAEAGTEMLGGFGAEAVLGKLLGGELKGGVKAFGKAAVPEFFEEAGNQVIQNSLTRGLISPQQAQMAGQELPGIMEGSLEAGALGLIGGGVMASPLLLVPKSTRVAAGASATAETMGDPGAAAVINEVAANAAARGPIAPVSDPLVPDLNGEDTTLGGLVPDLDLTTPTPSDETTGSEETPALDIPPAEPSVPAESAPVQNDIAPAPAVPKLTDPEPTLTPEQEREQLAYESKLIDKQGRIDEVEATKVFTALKDLGATTSTLVMNDTGVADNTGPTNLVRGSQDSSTNTIFLNRNLVRADTPIHEVGHGFIPELETSAPELYAQGTALVDGDAAPLRDAIKARYARRGHNLSEKDLRHEVLTTLLGNETADSWRQYVKNPKVVQQIQQWIAKFREWVDSHLRSKGIDPNMTMADFAKRLNRRVLAGKARQVSAAGTNNSLAVAGAPKWRVDGVQKGFASDADDAPIVDKYQNVTITDPTHPFDGSTLSIPLDGRPAPLSEADIAAAVEAKRSQPTGINRSLEVAEPETRQPTDLNQVLGNLRKDTPQDVSFDPFKGMNNDDKIEAGKFVVKMWKTLTKKDRVFQFGRTSSPSARDIAAAVSTPGREVEVRDMGDSILFYNKGGELEIRDTFKDTPFIRANKAGSQGKMEGGGSQLYAAALDWIHNNGKQIADDPAGLSMINATRRTSNFLASALRWGTATHLKPHTYQGLRWGGNDELNIAALAAKEAQAVFTRVPEAQGWRMNFQTGKYVDADGKGITKQQFDNAVASSDPYKSGVGLATLQRAVITQSAIEEFKAGNAEGLPELADFTDAAPARVAYSLEEQDAEYLTAVEDGDVEKQKMMVDAAARALIESFPRSDNENDIPNTGSISADGGEFEEFGVREVPTNLFGGRGRRAFYSVSDHNKVDRLLPEIERDGVKSPLIVVIDGSADGVAYVMEGAHRLAAIEEAKLTKFPALVLYDEDAEPAVHDETGKPLSLSQRFSPGTQFSVEPDQGFYSQAAKVMDAKLPNRVSPTQVRNMLVNPQNGVKPDELKWSGVLPWLESQNGQQVTKDQVVKFLTDAAKAQFAETNLGGGTPVFREWFGTKEAMMGLVSTDEMLVNPDGSLKDGLRPVKTERGWNLMDTGGRVSDTKYSQYQLPGGTNYREVVLAMPVDRLADTTGFEIIKNSTGRSLGTFGTREAVDRYLDRIMETDGEGVTVREKQTAEDKTRVPQYTSSHFREVPNYVAHMRLNDRTDSTGAEGTLIEELQSDRHQAGRKSGYQENMSRETHEVRPVMLSSRSTAPDGFGVFKIGDDTTSNAYVTEDEAYAAIDRGDMVEAGVADAPFRTSWPVQMFKRALRDAVETGKSWVGWTDGETQNERYDLSKQVSQIDFVPSDNGDYSIGTLYAFDLDGKEVMSERNVEPSQFEDYIGKDPAQKLIDQIASRESELNEWSVELDEETGEWNVYDPNGEILHDWGGDVETFETEEEGRRHIRDLYNRDSMGDGGVNISGLDLKIGGSGMKGFYDNILPKEIGKYVKQWGAKVEKALLDLTDGTEDSDGNALFGKDKIDVIQDGQVVTTYDQADPDTRRELAQRWIDLNRRTFPDSVFELRETRGSDTPIWRVGITPEMEASLRGQGQPLYSLEPDSLAQADADYMEAREAGDTERQQNIVEQIAKARGYDTDVRYKHGTTFLFNTFDKRKARPDGDFGAGFYLTNEDDDVSTNYAGEGPDLTGRIENLADDIQSNYELEDEITYEDALRMAREQIVGPTRRTIEAFTKFDNPVIFGGPQETFLDYSEEYNEELDEYSPPEGKLMDVVEGIRSASQDFDEVDAETLVSSIFEEAIDKGGLTASEVESILRESDAAASAMNANGDLALGEFIRSVFEEAGFDGIIDNNVNRKFGTRRRYGPAMDGVYDETVHRIAFKPEQIKSADTETFDDNGEIIPPSRRFNPGDSDIRFSLEDDGTKPSGLAANQPGTPVREIVKNYRYKGEAFQPAFREALDEYDKNKESGFTTEQHIAALNEMIVNPGNKFLNMTPGAYFGIVGADLTRTQNDESLPTSEREDAAEDLRRLYAVMAAEGAKGGQFIKGFDAGLKIANNPQIEVRSWDDLTPFDGSQIRRNRFDKEKAAVGRVLDEEVTDAIRTTDLTKEIEQNLNNVVKGEAASDDGAAEMDAAITPQIEATEADGDVTSQDWFQDGVSALSEEMQGEVFEWLAMIQALSLINNVNVDQSLSSADISARARQMVEEMKAAGLNQNQQREKMRKDLEAQMKKMRKPSKPLQNKKPKEPEDMNAMVVGRMEKALNRLINGKKKKTPKVTQEAIAKAIVNGILSKIGYAGVPITGDMATAFGLLVANQEIAASAVQEIHTLLESDESTAGSITREKLKAFMQLAIGKSFSTPDGTSLTSQPYGEKQIAAVLRAELKRLDTTVTKVVKDAALLRSTGADLEAQLRDPARGLETLLGKEALDRTVAAVLATYNKTAAERAAQIGAREAAAKADQAVRAETRTEVQQAAAESRKKRRDFLRFRQKERNERRKAIRKAKGMPEPLNYEETKKLLAQGPETIIKYLARNFGFDISGLIDLARTADRRAGVEALGLKFADALGLTKSQADAFMIPLVKGAMASMDASRKKRVENKINQVIKAATGRDANKKKPGQPTEAQRLIKLAEQGGLTAENIEKVMLKSMDAKKFTPEFVRYLESLVEKSNDVNLPQSAREQFTAAFLGAIRSARGVSAIGLLGEWIMANIFFAMNTFKVNALWGGVKSVADSAVYLATAPFTVSVDGENVKITGARRALIRQWLRGYSKDLQYHADYIFRTGKSKLESDFTTQFSNSDFETLATFPDTQIRYWLDGRTLSPGWAKAVKTATKFHKYVRRIMVGTDIVHRTPANEMLKAMAVVKLIAEKGGTIPNNPKAWAKAIDDAMYGGDFAQAKADAKKQVDDDIAAGKVQETERGIRFGEILDSKMGESLGFPDIDERRSEIIDQSIETAKRWTIANQTEGVLGAISNSMLETIQKVPGLKFLLPAVRMPIGAFSQGLDWSPYGFMRAKAIGWNQGKSSSVTNAIFNRDQIRKGWNVPAGGVTDERAIDLRTKASIGTSAALAIIAAVFSDLDEDEDDAEFYITGKGPEDPAKNRLWREKGYRPFMLRLGPLSVNYQESPAFAPLAVIGAWSDTLRYGEMDDAMSDKLAYIFTKSMSSFADAAVLKNLQEAVGSIAGSGYTTGSAVQGAGKWTSRTAGIILAPRIGTEINTLLYGPQSGKDQGWAGRALANVPFVPALYNKPAVNFFGEDIHTERGGPWGEVAPILAHRVAPMMTDDPQMQFVAKMGANYLSTSRRLKESAGGIRVMDDYDLVREWGQKSGAALRKWLTPAVMEKYTRLREKDPEDAEKQFDKAVLEIRTRELRRFKQVQF